MKGSERLQNSLVQKLGKSVNTQRSLASSLRQGTSQCVLRSLENDSLNWWQWFIFRRTSVFLMTRRKTNWRIGPRLEKLQQFLHTSWRISCGAFNGKSHCRWGFSYLQNFTKGVQEPPWTTFVSSVCQGDPDKKKSLFLKMSWNWPKPSQQVKISRFSLTAVFHQCLWWNTWKDEESTT